MLRRFLFLLLTGLLLTALSGHAGLAQNLTFAPAQLGDQRRWNSISDLLKAVEPAYSRQSDRRAAADGVTALRLDQLLDWSAEAGVLLLVTLQEPESGDGPAIRLGTPVLIAVGMNPFDAAAAGLSPGPLLAQTAERMRYAPQRSQFVWAAIEGNRLRFRHLTLAESLALRAAVTRQRVDDVAYAAQQRARITRIIGGVAARFLRQPGKAPFAATIEGARAAYERARSALDAGERNRQNWRAWAEGSAAGFDLVRKYQAVLTLAELRAQAQSLAIPALRDDIRRAPNAAALELVLGNHRDELQRRLAELDVPQLCRAELQAYNVFFASMVLEGEQERFVRRLLPEHSDVACLPANS